MIGPRLLHVFATFDPGGPQVRTVAIINALGGEFRHTVMAMDGRCGAAELLHRDVDVRIATAPPRSGSLRSALRMMSRLRRDRPDLLLTYNWGSTDALLAAVAVGCGPVLHHEETIPPPEQGAALRRRTWLRRAVLPCLAGVLVPSRTMFARARTQWRVPPARLHFVTNGVDGLRFTPSPGPSPVRTQLRIPDSARVVGWLAHLRPEKNPGRFLTAFATAAAAVDHALVVGDGQLRAATIAHARALGLAHRTHFVGHQQDPTRFLQAMDVFVLASDTEQAPIALLEAMATGLPVVATEVGDVRDILPPEQAPWIVPMLPAGNVTSRLAAALADLLRSRDHRAELGCRNRARALADFDLDDTITAYAARYRAAIVGAPGVRANCGACP